MTFIPKNARKILQNGQLARDFFLKPYGLQIPKNANFPKQHPEYKFFMHDIVLRRPGKEVKDNVINFRADPKLSKPELKQYLSKLYNLDITKINTVRYMGTVKKSIMGKPYLTKEYKKVYVETNHKINKIINGVY